MWAHGDAYQSNPETVETMMDIVHGYIFDIVSITLGDMPFLLSPIACTDDAAQATKTVSAKLRAPIPAFPSRDTINTAQASTSTTPSQKTCQSERSGRSSKGGEAEEEDAYGKTKGKQSRRGGGAWRVGSRL